MRRIFLAGAAVLLASPSFAYELKNLSQQDILVIGRGLDKLSREETDSNSLYTRIQQQLLEQDKATIKAASEKAEADFRAKMKAETEKPAQGDLK